MEFPVVCKNIWFYEFEIIILFFSLSNLFAYSGRFSEGNRSLFAWFLIDYSLLYSIEHILELYFISWFDWLEEGEEDEDDDEDEDDEGKDIGKEGRWENFCLLSGFELIVDFFSLKEFSF